MLVLVVGPSGAGKDTLLTLARQELATNPKFRFVRRIITRPADTVAPDTSTEQHEPISEADFNRRTFALSWQAHGLHYGIPLNIIQDLTQSTTVIANVSRAIIAEAATRFPVHVIQVTASPETLAQRLADRQRETANDVAKRLARNVAIPNHVSLDTIINDRTPAEAAGPFIAALIRAASPAPPE